MFNVKDRDDVLNQFRTDASEKVNEACKNLDIVRFMMKSDVDCVRKCIEKVEACVISSIPQGTPVPKVTIHVTPTGDEYISIITITASNKIKSNKQFKFTVKVTKQDTLETLKGFFIDIYAALIMDEMIETNLKIVNDVLEKVTDQAGVSYVVKVVSPLGKDGKVLYSIMDDEVEFVADVNRVFELDDILMLQTPNEDVTEEMVNGAIADEVEVVSGCQTTEQLVAKHGGMLVEYICDINKQVRPMTLIKKVCSKNVEKVKGDNDTFAYFNNGEVFALLYRRDGEFEIALSPFDIKTFRKADFDVLGAIRG